MEDNAQFQNVLRYILCFLLGEENETLVDCISYGSTALKQVNIAPSAFFDQAHLLKKESLPTLPLKEIDGIPLLFGDTDIHYRDGEVFTNADIVASTFFLITRYEEYIRNDVRDLHGRFPGKESLPYRANFLHRPVVEEYGRFLRKLLRLAGVEVVEPAKKISKVYLTHDVDAPWEFVSLSRRIKVAGKTLFKTKNPFQMVKTFFRPLEKDPYWTAFDWIKEKDEAFLKHIEQNQCEVLYFLLFGGKVNHDSPYARDVETTQKLIRKLQPYSRFGIHVSYYSGMHPENLVVEAANYEKLIGNGPSCSRYHFLSCREPGDLRYLLNLGITDDFTHAYGDVDGFRLGTCRPVQWIDIEKMEVTGLTLHPMTIMECTLDREDYMNLSEIDALRKSCELIDSVYEHAGEVVLLWHNTSVAWNSPGYQRQLYLQVLEHIVKRTTNQEDFKKED